MAQIILASASPIRAALLRGAGLALETRPARIDEDAARAGLEAEGASPRDIADALAEMKALKVSDRAPGALVIGCDQVLEHEGRALAKAPDPETAAAQLRALRGGTHRLLSAAVIAENGRPVWRHVGVVRLHMRALSDGYLDSYLSRNWDSVREAVGCYKLEEEGVRLFSRIEGQYFHVLGLPLMEILDHLILRGAIES